MHSRGNRVLCVGVPSDFLLTHVTSRKKSRRHSRGKRYYKRKYRRSKKVGYKQNRKYLRIKCSYQFDVHVDANGKAKYAVPTDSVEVGHYNGTYQHQILLHPFLYLKPLYDYYRVYGIKIRWESNVKNAYTQYGLTNATPQTTVVTGPDWNVICGHKMRVGMDMEDTMPLYVNTTPEASSRMKAKAHSMQYNWSQYFKIPNRKSNVLNTGPSRQNGNWYPADFDESLSNRPGGMIYIEQPSKHDTNALTSLYVGRVYVDKFIILKAMNYHAGQEKPVPDNEYTPTAGDDYVGDADDEPDEEDIPQPGA